jgi:hypothetical protein
MSGNSSDSDSSSSTRISGKLPKLVDDGTTNNYGEWKIESEILLLGWSLLEYVSGARSQPPDIPTLREPTTHKGIDEETGIERVIITRGNAKEHKRKKKAAKPWLKKNNAALSKIFQAVSGTKQIHLIKGIRYASTAWETLRTHYQPQNSALANSKRGDIQSYRCSPDMDVGEWLAEIRNRYNALFDLDPAALSDHDFAITIVNNLPQRASEWRSFAKGFRQRISQYKRMRPPQLITSSEVIDDIREELYFTAQDNPDADTHVFNADKKARKRPRESDVPTQIAAARDTTFPVVSLRAAAAKATIAMIGEGRGTSTSPSHSGLKTTTSPHALIPLFRESLRLVQLRPPTLPCKPISPPNSITNPPLLPRRMTPPILALSIPP